MCKILQLRSIKITNNPRLQNKRQNGLYEEKSVGIKTGTNGGMSMFSVVFELPLRCLQSEYICFRTAVKMLAERIHLFSNCR